MSHVHVIEDDPIPGDDVRRITARSGDGLDAVEVSVRIDTRTGPAKALAMLARASLEVLVRAREFKAEPAPVPASYEMRGARWNG